MKPSPKPPTPALDWSGNLVQRVEVACSSPSANRFLCLLFAEEMLLLLLLLSSAAAAARQQWDDCCCCCHHTLLPGPAAVSLLRALLLLADLQKSKACYCSRICARLLLRFWQWPCALVIAAVPVSATSRCPLLCLVLSLLKTSPALLCSRAMLLPTRLQPGVAAACLGCWSCHCHDRCRKAT